MTSLQMHAIVTKYLADHPDEWDKMAALLVFKALNETCTK